MPKWPTLRRHALGALALLTGLALAGRPALAQDKPVTIGVSIPAATHGWTGGVNYHAKEAVDPAPLSSRLSPTSTSFMRHL